MTVEERLRQSLAAQAAQVTADPDVVERLRAAPPPPQPRATWLLAAAVLAAVLAVAAVLAGDNAGGPASPGPCSAGTASSGMPSPRAGAAMAPVKSGVLVFGGTDFRGNGLVDTWIAECGRWRRAESPTTPPTGAAVMAYHEADDEVVLVVSGSTWLWRNEWRRGPAAPRLADVRMVYDAARREIVLAGRSDAGLEMWLWSSGGWREAPDASERRPSARHGFGLAYDRDRRVVVLFGGRESDVLLWDTWTWDGAGWTYVQDEEGPQGDTAGGYDERTKQVVAVDGLEAATLVWTGQWRRLGSIGGPGGRDDAPMAFDRSLGALVVFTGDRLWQWTGNGWRHV